MKRNTKPLGSAFPGSITLLGLALALLMAVPESQSAEDPRKSAFASWTFDRSGPVEKKNPLLVIGAMEFLELPEEEKKASLARGGTGWFARLQGGHLDAGREARGFKTFQHQVQFTSGSGSKSAQVKHRIYIQ